ncbi:MAG: PilZ domain-containing protein [Thermodesulfobacteriota bacterium]
MKNNLEKRRCHRFQIPGAYVRYQRGGVWKMISHLSPRKELANISKGGLCFDDDEKLNLGDKVTVYLYLPHGPSLSIKGSVVWKGGSEYTGYSIGVQFAAYKNGFGYNPMEVLDAMRTLEAIYSDHCDEVRRVA